MKFFLLIFLTVLIAGCGDESSALKKCKTDLKNANQIVSEASQIFEKKDAKIEELKSLVEQRENYINEAGKIIAHLQYCKLGKVAILCDSEKIKQAETLLNKGFAVSNDFELAKLYTVTIVIFLLPFFVILMIFLGWIAYKKSGLKPAQKQISDELNKISEKREKLTEAEEKITQKERDFNLKNQEKKLMELKKSILESEKEIERLEKAKKNYESISQLGKF